MVQSLSDLTDFNQALQCTDHALPYKFQTVFNADTWSSRRLSKFKFKLLGSLDGLLRRILQQDEQVIYISTGVQSSFFEQMFMGWALYYLNRRAFIFTTRRILLVQLKGKLKPWDLLAQIPYANIQKIKQTLLGHLHFNFSNGKSTTFIGMPKYDRKNISMISGMVSEKMSAESAAPGATEHLCPYCFTSVDGFPAACQSCAKPFKSGRKAGLLSLLFPGVGDMYLGHTGFATLEILGGALLWITVFLPDESGQVTSPLEKVIFALFLIVFMHGLDAVVTYRTGKKGIYPVKTGNR